MSKLSGMRSRCDVLKTEYTADDPYGPKEISTTTPQGREISQWDRWDRFPRGGALERYISRTDENHIPLEEGTPHTEVSQVSHPDDEDPVGLRLSMWKSSTHEQIEALSFHVCLREDPQML